MDMDGEHHALEILIPEGCVLAGDGGRRRAAGIVDEDIDRSKPAFDRSDMRLDRAEIGKIPLPRQRLAAFGFDCGNGLLGGGEIDIHCCNSGAFARKLGGNRAAQSAASAEHQGRLILQAEIHPVVSYMTGPSFGEKDRK